jgi:uncharacterized protein (TIGR03083 family)
LPAVQREERVAAVGRELAAVDEALAAGPMSATVPTCPGWSVADLARHLGDFCGFWAHVLCEGTGRDKPSFDMPVDDAALPGWFAGVGRALAEQLGTTPADTAVWTWHPTDKTPRFVARRSANELAIHRYDLESARGTCRPIERALAVEGIEEIVGDLIEGAQSTGEARGETLHLHGTDAVPAGAGTEWLLTLHPDRIEVTRGHAKGDLALRGAVSDLELLLYGRPALGPVERLGDEAVLDLWQREFRF